MEYDSVNEFIKLVDLGMFEVDVKSGDVYRLRRFRKYGASRLDSFSVGRRVIHGRKHGDYKTIRITPIGSSGVISVRLHRVIWTIANGKIPDGMQINHKNGHRWDNRIENLELVTASENTTHAYRVLGKCDKSGGKHWNAKVTRRDAILIHSLCRIGCQPKLICRRFGISKPTYRRITTGIHWIEVDENSEEYTSLARDAAGMAGDLVLKDHPSRLRGCVKLNAEKAEQIRAMRKSGKKLREIASIYSITEAAVSRICLGKMWA